MRGHDETRPEALEDYDVVGATLAPTDDDPPMRVRPVMRTRAEPHAYALLYEREGEEVLVPEEREFIEEKFAEGRFYRLPVPLRARPGYWLVQVMAETPLEYLPALRAQDNIREQGERALRHSARATIGSDLHVAREKAAYASRALLDDPLPHLALVALARDVLTESQLWLRALPLQDFSTEAIRQRFREAWHDKSLAPLTQRICQDPLCLEYDLIPDWFLSTPPSLPGNPPRPSKLWQLEEAA